MTDCRLTKSLDHIHIEICNINGVDYVEIIRHTLVGNTSPLIFLKGDEPAACKFLSSLSELMGIGQVEPSDKKE